MEARRHRDPRQVLAKIVGKTLAVVRGVQDSVDVVKDVVLGDRVVQVALAEHHESPFGDVVNALK